MVSRALLVSVCFFHGPPTQLAGDAATHPRRPARELPTQLAGDAAARQHSDAEPHGPAKQAQHRLMYEFEFKLSYESDAEPHGTGKQAQLEGALPEPLHRLCVCMYIFPSRQKDIIHLLIQFV